MKPIVWSIAGHDPSGGAGITLDSKVFHALGVHGCTIATCDTVQTTQGVKEMKQVEPSLFAAQIQALQQDLPPRVIKLGALSAGCFEEILCQAQDDVNRAQDDADMSSRAPIWDLDGKSVSSQALIRDLDDSPFIICDPILAASSGQPFLPADHYHALLSHVDLLTPNWPEASQLSGVDIVGHDDVPKAAQALHAQGVKAVLITGGHGPGDTVAEYFSDGQSAFWLTLPRLPNTMVHGTGCALSSAIAAMVAQGHDLKDAVVIAKMVLHQAIEHAQHLGQGASLLTEFSVPSRQAYLPNLMPSQSTSWDSESGDVSFWPPIRDLENVNQILCQAQDDIQLSSQLSICHPGPRSGILSQVHSFKPCGDLGLYVIVDSVAWVERLLTLNVKTLQLRIKNATQAELAKQIQQSVVLCQQYGAKLFINDYWQLAIEHGAYGVHLGQEDLDTADLNAIHQAGLRLGISTHCFYEVARAHACRPSYLAYGPVYHTDSKPMAFGPRGLEQLAYWQQTLDYPLVAIGGITQQRLPDILATGVKSTAVISAITQAENVEAAVKTMQVEGNGLADQ